MKIYRLQSRFIFTACGNSSVVERNLAMVDVASSTLVSRSILTSNFKIPSVPLAFKPQNSDMKALK